MRRTRPAAALAAVVLIALGAAGVWLARSRRPPPLASASCRGCNLLLVTIDTLRADRVGAFGSARGLTPTIDRLAAGGLRLTRAYTSAPLTLPAHASLLTSSSPPVHGVRNNSLFRLRADAPTLATVLKEAGYRTGAFVGAFVLDARFGLGRGFDVYDDRYGDKAIGDPGEGPERRAEDVVTPARAWILGAPASTPWFAWVHLYDPHAPYNAPEPFASRSEPYDAENAYTDAALASLIDALAARGELDHTLVVFTADHGESLGEHGEPTHGVFVYEATMKVPAFVWAGERIGNRSYGGVVRLTDLAPTAAALLGVAVPPAFEGRSLLTAIDTGEAETPPAYVEAMDSNLTRNWAPLTGLVSGAFKLIDLPIPELYDLANDPGETVNLFTRDAERARVLTSLLREQTAQFASRASPAARTSLDTEARQRLQALGYATAAADPAARVYGDADDPKMLMPAANDLDRALASFRQGGGPSAMAAAQAIVTAHPGFTTAYGVLASMQRDSGDLPAAIATLEAVMRRGIADQSVMVVLGSYLQEAGALDQAAALLQAVIGSHPDYADAYNGLGVVYSRQGRHGDARAAFKKVIELDPTAATTYQNLAIDEFASGDFTAAAADLTRALAADPRLAGAHNALAAVHMRQGRTSDAIAEWQAALKANPQQWDALFNLGTVLYDAGRRDEARPYLERFVREAPRSRYAADIKKIETLLVR